MRFDLPSEKTIRRSTEAGVGWRSEMPTPSYLSTFLWSQQLRGKQAKEYSRWVESLGDRSLLSLLPDELLAAGRAAERRERQREIAYLIARGIEKCPQSLYAVLSRDR
jgi:hypothetical protein